ncbi:putative methyltransferase-domain-containing protein [Scleroderma yunnanense]
MSDEESEGDLPLQHMFSDLPRPPTPPATFARYARTDEHHDINGLPSEVKIRLVGSHPLWGHHLWNAAIALARYLEMNQNLVQDKFVLELGAGGGLPGIVSAQIGAAKVVLTDYPDNELLENLRFNIDHNISLENRVRADVQGYIWGQSVDHLLDALPPNHGPGRAFDLIILSDLVFNHSQHDALLKSCELCLTSHTLLLESSAMDHPAPSMLVFYTHHRPHLAHRDLTFFDKARTCGWICEKVVTRKFPVSCC